jgi:hypothetical protein
MMNLPPSMMPVPQTTICQDPDAIRQPVLAIFAELQSWDQLARQQPNFIAAIPLSRIARVVMLIRQVLPLIVDVRATMTPAATAPGPGQTVCRLPAEIRRALGLLLQTFQGILMGVLPPVGVRLSGETAQIDLATIFVWLQLADKARFQLMSPTGL